jgi:MOSC domain-containing protein YiiM
MLIASVQVGLPRTYADGWTSAFRKDSVSGPVPVRRLGLDGDGQHDRRHHGGEQMAALAYSADHYPHWREELEWPSLPLGGFGENLSVSGATEETACIGDIWRAGTALLQISSPRMPCGNISRYWERPKLLRLVERSGRIGWYLRVLEEGTVEAGQEIALVDRPHPESTVARAFRVRREK